MARVTVLLTCYNHLAYLPACIEGIANQTFKDFEVIALDDGSKDGTREYLSQLQVSFPLKIVFNEENLGTYETLNVGLRLATSEFIAVLNDDDLWSPEKLAKQVALMDNHPEVGVVHTDGYFIDAEGIERKDSPLGFSWPRFTTGDTLPALIYENKIIASAALIRKSCFDQVGEFNPKYFGSGDWEMWFRIAEHHQFGFVAEPLTMYRVHGENASHKLERIWRDDAMLRTWIAMRLPIHKNRFKSPSHNQARSHNFACLGTVLTLIGEATLGRKAYAQSLRINPFRFKSWLRLFATFLPNRFFRKLL
jgi:glycosyltransferase involved in cell wall biosynthesis